MTDAFAYIHSAYENKPLNMTLLNQRYMIRDGNTFCIPYSNRLPRCIVKVFPIR